MSPRRVRLTARVRANRRNAKLSTGPRSPDGKARVACNALRHGLAVPIGSLSELEAKVNELVSLLAGEGADSERLQAARRVAEAEVDLDRVRRLRMAILRQAAELRTPSTTKKILSSLMADRLLELQRLDRYQGRALSRRKFAIRALDALETPRRSGPPAHQAPVAAGIRNRAFEAHVSETSSAKGSRSL